MSWKNIVPALVVPAVLGAMSFFDPSGMILILYAPLMLALGLGVFVRRRSAATEAPRPQWRTLWWLVPACVIGWMIISLALELGTSGKWERLVWLWFLSVPAGFASAAFLAPNRPARPFAGAV